MVRTYGQRPFRVAVLHGGPGAPGYMAPVARDLSEYMGVIEPLQAALSLDDQVEELHKQLDAGDPPLTVIGSSWGAVLALFLAARHPRQAGKLILVGSAVFDADSSASIAGLRRERLSDVQRQRLEAIEHDLKKAAPDKRRALFAEWGSILSKADIYDGAADDLETLEVQPEIFEQVWPDFVALRDQPGRLQKEFATIEVPAVVIHGEYDPHPIEGIRPFLEQCLTDVRFHILPECGHYPWLERRARDRFFEILRAELPYH